MNFWIGLAAGFCATVLYHIGISNIINLERLKAGGMFGSIIILIIRIPIILVSLFFILALLDSIPISEPTFSTGNGLDQFYYALAIITATIGLILIILKRLVKRKKR